MDRYSTYNDWSRLLQNAEPMTLLSRQPGNAAPLAWAVPLVGRKPSTGGEAVRGGALVSVPASPFAIWQAMLDSATPVAPATGSAPAPKEGDELRDAAGVVYVIDNIDIHLYGNVFQCHARPVRATA